MSASTFLRNFAMGTEENNCYLPRETGHCNDDPKIEKNQGGVRTIVGDNSSDLVEQLQDNSGHVQINTHSFSLEDNHFQAEPILSTAPSRLAKTIPGPELSCVKSILVNQVERSSDNLHNKIVSESKEPIVRESRNSNATKTKSNQSEADGNSSKSVNRKRIAVAAGIVYEDKVSSLEGSQGATTTQTLLSSDHSVEAREVPSSSSHHSVNNHVTSSSFSNRAHAMVFSKLPPGATLISPRGIFLKEDKEKSFLCGYCAKAFDKEHAVCCHIGYHHKEKRFNWYVRGGHIYGVLQDPDKRYSCEFCGECFVHQNNFSQHLMIHALTSVKSGKRFRLKRSLRRNKFPYTGERPSCNICHKSFKCGANLFKHSKVHREEACRKDVVCNICKKVFRLQSALKKHMKIHSGKKPLRRLLCRVQGDTVTSNKTTCSSGRQTEIKNESTAEYGQNSLPNTEIHTNVVCPGEFTNLQAICDGSLKEEGTEEEVLAPTDILDELFQDYISKLNVTSLAK